MLFGDDRWWTPLAGTLSGSGILLLVAVVGMLLYKTDDAMGIGDVKLLAPIGMFLGWKLGILALLLSIILAGTASLLLIIVRLKKKRDTIPFGPFIVIGYVFDHFVGLEYYKLVYRNAIKGKYKQEDKRGYVAVLQIKNYMEEIVYNQMKEVLSDISMCTCEKCLMDVRGHSVERSASQIHSH